ncbi:NAD-dependent epimerase/dehydratase family protein [Falsirhodobacter halotolerans]|uniref:NAD-dependent epimerase/dehydratase family protein n=1 Tax=Falsirhodobacter halotolerans TaxID=1146892 RepID=UPI001FD31089|nr:NAD-dependent epimerase/dehydratase family protein [Falsirhodobacter halotolerans]MCJ8138334.1 NAD-dependent epimerase/dehydratase family protein [Falsirhodobacter halotolerans]
MPTDLIVTGATGRLARLLRPHWPDAIWLARGDAWPQGRGGTILNLAGVTDPQGPMEDNVTTAAAALAEGARRGARVFLMSSAAVYGTASGDLTEDMAPTPVSPYGAAKARMEDLARTAQIPVCVLRLGNVAGADALLRATPPVTLDPVAGGRGPVRSYIGPATLAHVLRALMHIPDLPPVLNIAAPGPVAMADLLDAAGLPWAFGPPRAGAIPRVALCTARLQALVPLPPADPAAMIAEGRAA